MIIHASIHANTRGPIHLTELLSTILLSPDPSFKVQSNPR